MPRRRRACPSSAGGSTLAGFLLPVAQAWHMHAVLQSRIWRAAARDEAQGGHEALLRGPLAGGEGPSEWCATLRAARAAFDERADFYAHRRTGRQEEDDEGEDDEEDDEEEEED